MNLINAIDVIRDRLPRAVAKAVDGTLKEDSSLSELTVKGFGISKVESVPGLMYIVERRLVHCENPTKEAWHRAQLDLLRASLEASEDPDLWQGYIVDGETRTFFIIDSMRGRLCTGPYP